MEKTFCKFLAAVVVWFCLATPALAQWKTETNTLSRGWNGVFLLVDASHTTISNLLGTNSPIEEIWLWKPSASTLNVISDPGNPVESGSDWAQWTAQASGTSPLQRLVGNAACLVKLKTNYVSATYNWIVTGKPVVPRYTWSTSGLNFIGFSIRPTSSPTFANFLQQSPGFLETTELYRYSGNDLATNPILIPDFLTSGLPVKRGQAFWMRRKTGFDDYNRYYGPFEVDTFGLSGLHFHDSLGRHSVRLRNVTTNQITVTMTLVASDPVPAGVTNTPAIESTTIPLLIRGALNTTDLTYSSTPFIAGSSTNYVLAATGQPGSEVEIVLGVDRTAMSQTPGKFYAGILRFSDPSYMQFDTAVSAETPSSAGLWVGVADIYEVQHDLTSYLRDDDESLVVSTDPGTEGQYIAVTNNNSLGAVARSMPLRLILHQNSGGSSVLLQRAYYGVRQNTNFVIATKEELLDADKLASARRISAVHLPWSKDNLYWLFTTNASSMTTTVYLDQDDHASSPFLHTYHPDHDNLNATFTEREPQGAESYSVSRQITLTPTPSANDFDSLTSGSLVKGGIYDETILFLGRNVTTGTNTVTHARTNHIRGVYSLTRVSEISTLTTP